MGRARPPTPRGDSLQPYARPRCGRRGSSAPPPDACALREGGRASSLLGALSGPAGRSPAVRSPEPVPPPPSPCPGGDHGEPLAKRIEKGDEAFRAGHYEKAAELFPCVLAGCRSPSTTCARAGRLPEALGAFRGAARLQALRPEELGS